METTALRRRLSSRSSLCSSSSSGVSLRLNSMCIRFLFSADAASATSAARTASSRRLVSTRDAENSERASSSDERAAFARVSTSPEARAPFAVASRSASSASCVSLEAATSLTCAAAVIASAAATSSRRSFKDLRPSSWLVNPSASSSAVVLISFKPCSNFWTFFLCSSSMNLMVSSASFCVLRHKLSSHPSFAPDASEEVERASSSTPARTGGGASAGSGVGPGAPDAFAIAKGSRSARDRPPPRRTARSASDGVSRGVGTRVPRLDDQDSYLGTH